MKKIKFRAWHKTWSPQEIDKTDCHRKGQKINGMVFVKGLWWGNSGVGHVELGGWASSVSIEDIELMQFTGLLDCHGKEIFEGDIVSYPDTYTDKIDVGVGMLPAAQKNSFFVVEFSNGMFGMKVKNSETMSAGFHSLDEFANELSEKEKGDTLEIIGNIYENPNLLK